MSLWLTVSGMVVSVTAVTGLIAYALDRYNRA